MGTAKSFRMHTQTTDPQGQALEVLMEVVKPDREHIKMTRGQAVVAEYISVGPDFYLADPSGKWTKLPVQSSAGAPAQTAILQAFTPDAIMKGFNEGASKGDKLTRGGQSIVDGVPCQEWVHTPADTTTGAGTMCIGLMDNLPRRFTVLAQNKVEQTVTFSDWNAQLGIDPPI
jgi:hypothetical protein